MLVSLVASLQIPYCKLSKRFPYFMNPNIYQTLQNIYDITLTLKPQLSYVHLNRHVMHTPRLIPHSIANTKNQLSWLVRWTAQRTNRSEYIPKAVRKQCGHVCDNDLTWQQIRILLKARHFLNVNPILLTFYFDSAMRISLSGSKYDCLNFKLDL